MDHITNVIVSLQVAGMHAWSTCPIEEVSYLRSPHRHIFHIKAKKAVEHDDRDVEIIILKRNIGIFFEEHFKTLPCGAFDFGNMSCESIAYHVAVAFQLSYCEVLEDGENGAEVIMRSDDLPF